MLMRSFTVAAVAALAFGAPASTAVAQQSSADKNKQKAANTSNGKQASTGKNKPKRVAQGPKQRHQCTVGPYEKQTRLVMETVKNKPVYIAYWSSDGPFHCSFETWPGDGRAQWVESKGSTLINLISGTMRIERNGDKYFVHASEVDRMPYCGTFGSITGVLTVPVKKGPCDWKEVPSEASQQKEGPAAAPEAPAQPPGSSSAAVGSDADPG